MDTFAQRFWKEFELLSLEYIHDQYKDTSAQCIHTAFINDGGFDGKLTLDLTKDEAPFVHEVLSLIEAKLRTDNNITIHDFAASIIAAYNFSANILYVVSNMNFTEGTRKTTATFSNKVNLKIILIDGAYLLTWLESKKLHQDNKSFICELIDSIKNNVNNVKNAVSTKYVHKDNNLTENNSDIFTDDIYLQPEKLFGLNAQTIKEKIICILDKIDAIDRTILLSGAIGTGKSTVITNVGYELQQKNFIFNILDGDNEDALSIRSVFLWVLKSLWGIDPFKIYTSDNISEFIDVICFTADVHVEPNIKETIREVFLLDDCSYLVKSDLYTTYLLRYLNIILEKRRGKNRTVMAIKNLHRLDQPVLDFVISLIRCLIQNNVGLIIELAPLEVKTRAKNNWETGRDAICYFSQFGHIYELFDFEKDDAWNYLSENLPGLSNNYYEYMLLHIGLKPVFLRYAINWLILNEVVLCDSSSDYYTVAKPDDFFNGITPDQNIRIIEDIISYYQSNICEYQDMIIELFELIALLDGVISYSLIREIYPSYSMKKIIQILLNTGLFVQTSTGINVNHELVLTALTHTSYSYYQFCAAEKLYDALKIVQDEEFIRCKKADLLIIMKHWEEFNLLSIQIGEDAFETGEYKKSIKYFSLCRKYHTYLEKKNNSQLLHVMYKELLAYEKIAQSGSAKKLFEAFQVQIKLIKEITKKEPEKYILTLEKLYLSRYAGSAVQYSMATDMLAYAKQNYDVIPTELYVSICYVYALIVKKYISLECAVEFLKKEKESLPDSIELDIQYQSHEAAKYLNSDPVKAIDFYKNIVGYSGISQKHNRDIGHAYVDILNCQILLEDWENFECQYFNVLEYLQANALYEEEGRLYNLDGLYYWINSDLLASKESFQNSQFYFGLVHNKMNAIISKINYIGVLISLQKFDDAILEFSVACTHIIQTYGVLYSQIETTKDYRKHREYIALLVLIKYGHDLKQTELIQKLIEKVPIHSLPDHVDQFIKGIYPADVFSDTCIVHNGIIALTR